MADMHVLNGDGVRWRIAMHFAVPDQNNAVGVAYRVALVNSGLGGSTELAEGTGVGEIATAEKVLIEAGTLYEHLFSFRVESNGDDLPVIQTSLRAAYARESGLVLARLQEQLRYYGHTEAQV